MGQLCQGCRSLSELGGRTWAGGQEGHLHTRQPAVLPPTPPTSSRQQSCMEGRQRPRLRLEIQIWP